MLLLILEQAELTRYIFCRWRVPHIHHTVYVHATTEPRSLKSGDPLIA